MDSPSSVAFDALFEQAPVALILADREGRIMAWNRASQSLFGFAAAEVAGQSLDVIIPEHLRDAHWTGYDRSLASGDTKYAGQVMTTRAVHKDGRRLYVDFSFSMLKDAQGRVIGAIAAGRDGTERFLAERSRRMKEGAA
ncbi:MAG TPA: PAS domain S-box protein [Usitatibacter sp.]|jgi:PAS domain S-box-containing protein|nr:PAS domain S-box protein [Usitatibacter sp.]